MRKLKINYVNISKKLFKNSGDVYAYFDKLSARFPYINSASNLVAYLIEEAAKKEFLLKEEE